MQVNHVEQVDLDTLAHVVETMDYSGIHKLGWYAMRMQLMGYTPDMTPLSVVVYFDRELDRAVARHE